MLEIIRSSDTKAIGKLLRARSTTLAEAEAVVRPILEDIRRRGDRALLRYAKKFDRLDFAMTGLTVSREEIRRAYREVPRGFVAAVRVAAANIRKAARKQLPRMWTCNTSAGVRVGQIIRPLERVACYVPGGRFPLPSTVLMSVIPAQEAGVSEVIVTSPRPAPAVLVAADLLGVKKIYRLGGAQAIAAFAFGTESVPRVDKIVGPGNRYVAAAKKLVAGECGIDFIAGPSELVLVGGRGNAEWIASDLVAQAEHDPEALAIFITTRADLAKDVVQNVNARSANNAVASEALDKNGLVILLSSVEEARAITNRLAPEHLTVDTAADLDWVQNAGSVFVGRWSAQPMGDYISGPNHTLPTGGMARVRGGLSVNDFVKLITVQKYSSQAMRVLGPPAALLAEAEGLIGHAEAIRTRLTRRTRG